MQTLSSKVLLVVALAIGSGVAAYADSAANATFANSATGPASSSNTPVTINVTFNNNHTAVLSTGTGFQYNGGFGCSGGFCYYNQGWWTLQPAGNGQVEADAFPNSNYLVGQFGLATYRDFFSFDTAGLTQADVASGIKSAQFMVQLYNTSGAGAVQFVLSQATIASSLLNDTIGADWTTLSNAARIANFTALGNGTVVGNLNLNLPTGLPTSTIETIDLNSSAFTQITSAYNNSGTASDAHVFTFGGELNDAIITPEPASFLLFASGLAGVFFRRRKR